MLKKLFLFVLLMVTAACSQFKEEEWIGIRGTIQSIDGNEIHVVGEIEEDTDYDNAFVTITDDTLIETKDSETQLDNEELKEGNLVEVIFEGGVQESYPVQGSAKVVRILE
ncbi:DUF3221 domain-containing protein [Bacillus kexueae]|uniref:DUF3221 domain-containing protein n=1 Tax=Aeribacillus kexueae TaxID=2078952 RepID=UPI001FAE9014|nr:DUF3221 domain-containing protein [Bacillus kexueae]